MDDKKPSTAGRSARNLLTSTIAGATIGFGACAERPEDTLVRLSRNLQNVAQKTELVVDVPDGNGGYEGVDMTARIVDSLLSSPPEQYEYRADRSSETYDLKMDDVRIHLEAQHYLNEDAFGHRMLVEGSERSIPDLADCDQFAKAAFELIQHNWKVFCQDIQERGDSITSSWLPSLITDLNNGSKLPNDLVSSFYADHGVVILQHRGFEIRLMNEELGKVYDQEVHEFDMEIRYISKAGKKIYSKNHHGDLAREAYDAVSKKLARQ